MAPSEHVVLLRNLSDKSLPGGDSASVCVSRPQLKQNVRLFTNTCIVKAQPYVQMIDYSANGLATSALRNEIGRNQTSKVSD